MEISNITTEIMTNFLLVIGIFLIFRVNIIVKFIIINNTETMKYVLLPVVPKIIKHIILTIPDVILLFL